MSLVFQQFNLYPHMTVLKNLTLAPMKLHHKTKAEAEELAYHYLEVVGLRDKADVYPPQLSGGQQQRISIARAILKDAPIVVFDEATSYSDIENEHKIQLALQNLLRGKTTIMIAHRLHTIRNADNIVVFQDGKVAEQGTHDELIARGSTYSHMWDTYTRETIGEE